MYAGADPTRLIIEVRNLTGLAVIKLFCLASVDFWARNGIRERVDLSYMHCQQLSARFHELALDTG